MTQIDILQRLAATLAQRKQAAPTASYVSGLYAKGTDAICKKVAEEAAETIMAAKDGGGEHLVYEVADLWFHSMILLTHFGLSPEDVLRELERREGVSGIEEKKARQA
ncbi:MAG: phosphoribosyl-ATP diphosphatase [Candidatus Dactylopiibacterium carminicum]|uniref:Phosphoribosyl-ATP pyrophosphatase n=1 Tax=Candidatus Dactylopiibacterium carminicum TaxID=857335 RepID=A0A272EV63_9RHOO|nr:phosphoribosyl-ATP diphosphatase [Candidatus Dactylopiibacterium carminicum]KAF7599835.1 phosphoribosyl-ATP diphosphatase [Candidatus Dactylopiibacterium carminicum]PAS93946.1 MAG: phosphoribosyl-ATP diphosphatase [Candidatus Dactylopiibacterium carminicum]PAS97261.1 MAG: phosphoribosyl-ATP diphosphatase [Candidatus Dactylopiibacterium carminicum]PAS99835.1 MAG: phosphoribosyl-ATP diphosphatase [Candidatus Dactylopiibacterium carminicum]